MLKLQFITSLLVLVSLARQGLLPNRLRLEPLTQMKGQHSLL